MLQMGVAGFVITYDDSENSISLPNIGSSFLFDFHYLPRQDLHIIGGSKN